MDDIGRRAVEAENPERLTDSAKRCAGCGERIDATHQPKCLRGQGRVHPGQDEIRLKPRRG